MIQKIYVVMCDKCGCQIDYYKNYKPSATQLRKHMPLCMSIDGKLRTFCVTCAVQMN